MQYEDTLFYHFAAYPLLLERFYFNKYYYFTNLTFEDLNKLANQVYSKNECEKIILIYKNYVIDKLIEKYTTVIQYDIFGEKHNIEVPSKNILIKLIVDYAIAFYGDLIDVTTIYNMFYSVYNTKVMTRQQIRDLIKDIEEITIKDNDIYQIKIIEKETDIIDKPFFDENITKVIETIHKDNLEFIYQGYQVKALIEKEEYDKLFFFSFLKESLIKIGRKIFLRVLFKNPDKPTDKEKRNIEIMLQRKEHKTLSKIGDDYDLAKERIRQIMEEYIIKFQEVASMSNALLLRIIKGYAKNQYLITKEDVTKIIGKDTDIFMYLLERINIDTLVYSIDINGFIFDSENWFAIVDNILDMEKQSLSINEAEELINRIIQELKNSGVDLYYSPIQKKFHSVYTLKGNIYNKTNLTQSGKYKIIMDLFFKDGFLVHNQDEMGLFRLKYEETFTESLENKTTRSIEGRIEDTCILIDRGRYKTYKGEKLSSLLTDKIESYMDVSINKTFAFNSLFMVFLEDLKSEKVENRYYFQALLKRSVKNKYYFTRDYISKQKDSTFIEEIEKVIYQNEGIINLDAVNQVIPGITQIMFVAAMDKLNMISLFNGDYISLNNIKLMDNEYHKMDALIENMLRGDKIISAKEFYNLAKYELPNLFKDNDINAYSLYGIAKSCFRDKYQFKRPFIAHNEVEIGDRKERIMAFLSDYKLINISDLREFMLENDLIIPDMLCFIEELDTYLRNDENSLIMINLMSIDDDVIKNIEKALDNYQENELLKNVDCTNFPTIGVSWNYWLLSSILNKYGIKYQASASNNSYKAPAYILKRKI